MSYSTTKTKLTSACNRDCHKQNKDFKTLNFTPCASTFLTSEKLNIDSLLYYSKPFRTTTISRYSQHLYAQQVPDLQRQARVITKSNWDYKCSGEDRCFFNTCRLPDAAMGWRKSKAIQILSCWLSLSSLDRSCSSGCWGKLQGISSQWWVIQSLVQEPYGDYSFCEFIKFPVSWHGHK